MEISLLIKRCLAHGVIIYPYMLDRVLKKYDRYQIPDEVLKVLNKEDLEKYVRGLYLCSGESAGQWVEGHKLLKQLGFEEKKRKDGHRVFIGLIYKDTLELISGTHDALNKLSVRGE